MSARLLARVDAWAAAVVERAIEPRTCSWCHRPIRGRSVDLGDGMVMHRSCPPRLTARGRLVVDVLAAAFLAPALLGAIAVLAIALGP